MHGIICMYKSWNILEPVSGGPYQLENHKQLVWLLATVLSTSWKSALITIILLLLIHPKN